MCSYVSYVSYVVKPFKLVLNEISISHSLIFEK